MPGMRPESRGPVCAVTPCRTSTRRVSGLCSVFSGDAPLAAAASVVVAAVSVIGASLPATFRGQVGAGVRR